MLSEFTFTPQTRMFKTSEQAAQAAPRASVGTMLSTSVLVLLRSPQTHATRADAEDDAVTSTTSFHPNCSSFCILVRRLAAVTPTRPSLAESRSSEALISTKRSKQA